MSNLVYSSVLDGDTLTISVGGRVDSDNTGKLREYFAEECQQAHEKLVLDLEGLEYISSAGLRVLLAVRKNELEAIKALNVNPAVYEILEMTGFTQMLEVSRSLRHVSIQDCEIIGQGAQGGVYRLDKDSIIKVFKPHMPRAEVERERSRAQEALLRGIPTAIPYDIVQCGDSLGVVYEMLSTDTLSGHIIKEPERLEHYAKEYARTVKRFHDSDVRDTILPDIRKRRMDGLLRARQCGGISQEQYEGCKRFFDLLPERTTFIHGDLNPNNYMIHNGETLLVDMGGAGYGHPIMDIASAYLITGFVGRLEGNLSEAVEGMTNIMTAEQLLSLWEIFIREYFGIEDRELLDILEKQCETFALLNMVIVGGGGLDMGIDEEGIKMCKASGEAFLFPDLDERYEAMDFSLWGDAVDGKTRRKTGAKKHGLMVGLAARKKGKAQNAQAVDPAKISIDSKIKDIIDNEAAMAILERYIPGIGGNKQLKMAYGMTLRAIQKFPQAGISEEQLTEIEKEFAGLL